MAIGIVPVLTDVAIAILDNVVTFPSQNFIGDIAVDTTIEELYDDTIEITEHPVQVGAQISDHAFKRPMEVVMRCGWSDSSIQASLGGAVADNSSFAGGAMWASDYVAGIYSQLLGLQQTLQPFELTTGLRRYDAMVLSSLIVRRDQRTKFVLMVEAVMRQVILVSTQNTTLPPQANQAFPANTAEVVNAGAQSTQTGATPSPGGSLPPSNWNGSNPFSVTIGSH